MTWLLAVHREDDALLQNRKKEKRESKRSWQCSSSGREAGRPTRSERFTRTHSSPACSQWKKGSVFHLDASKQSCSGESEWAVQLPPTLIW